MKDENLEKTENSSTLQEEEISDNNEKKNKLNKRKEKEEKKKNVQNITNIKILKDEEKEFVEFVLGDFYDFHKINDLQNFTKMTSLSLINERIEDMGKIIENIPNKEAMIYLCMNENKIKEINNIHLLPNLKSLHLNFNQIKNINEEMKQLKKLKTFWICENKIKIIENIPEEIENLWISNNLIENIPNDFCKYKYLKTLNISGNLIIDFQNIYNIEKLPKLKKLYLNDINYGENPICTFANYKMMMLHFFKKIEILDQFKINHEEKEEIQSSYLKKMKFYKNKIKQTYKISKMIFHLMKGHKLFFKGIKYHQVRLLSQQMKLLEYKIYENEELGFNSDLKIEDIHKEINIIKYKIINNLKEIETLNNNFKEIKQQITDLNDFSIVTNFYENESFGNYKLEPGTSGLKWVNSCLDLFKIPKEFFNKNELNNIKFNKIYRIHNQKTNIIFHSIYDNLIDINNKFGDEKQFFDFNFLILPKDILYSKRNLLQYLFEKQENEKEIILSNNCTLIDQFSLNQDKKINKFIVIICKCINFENLFKEIKTEKEFKNLNEIISEIKNIKNEKDVTKLIIEKANTIILHYKLKGAVEPQYIVEYEYVYKEKKEKSIFLSSYNHKIYINNDHEKIFNLCSRELSSDCNKQFFSKEIINKYLLSNFSKFSELDKNMIFFSKNTILYYLKQCFKYKSLNDFKDDLNKINDGINEITFFEFKKNFKKAFLSNDDNEKLKPEKIKSFNVFNNEFSTDDLNQFFKQIKEISNIDPKILLMLKKIEKVILSDNYLETINLYNILQLFPNAKEIDLSHNNINKIIYEPLEINNNVRNFDISFNDIEDFSNIILIINQFKGLLTFKFFANPFNLFCEKNFCDNPSIFDLTNERKEYIINTYNNYIKFKETEDLPITIEQKSGKVNSELLNFLYLYECYSFNDKYKDFSNNPYFREKYHQDTSLNIVNLTNKKLRIIPIIEGGEDTQSLYINLNNIIKISNLEQFNNLIELYIQNNKIKYLENIPKSIIKLDISNNELQNLDNLSELTNLVYLNIENNSIDSLSEVIKLSKLTEFYASGNLINNIKECCQLGKLKKLEVIDINSNEVCIINPNIRITMIYYCNNLKTFNGLLVNQSEKVQSKEYFSGRLTIELLEKRLGLDYCTQNLLDLDLSSLKLKDEINLFSKESYPILRKLNLSNNIFKSFSIFGSLPNLKELNLNFNLFVESFPKKEKISKGKGLFGLPNLEYLEMSNNQLVSLNGLQFFKNLKSLILKENCIKKIEYLNDMDDLIYLDVSNNKIKDVDKTLLGDLPSLQIFICDNNSMKNINGFSKYESIESISFQNNKIQDLNCIEQFSELNKLKEITLKGNPITKYNNYRINLIRLLPYIRKIDGKEITEEERNNSKKEELKPIADPNFNYNIDINTGQRLGGNYYYNFNALRNKEKKKSVSTLNNNNCINLKNVNLPQILSNKSISSQTHKRIFNRFSNSQINYNSNEKIHKTDSNIINLSKVPDINNFKEDNKYKLIPDEKQK